jgi:hypothetical protein
MCWRQVRVEVGRIGGGLRVVLGWSLFRVQVGVMVDGHGVEDIAKLR